MDGPTKKRREFAPVFLSGLAAATLTASLAVVLLSPSAGSSRLTRSPRAPADAKPWPLEAPTSVESVPSGLTTFAIEPGVAEQLIVAAEEALRREQAAQTLSAIAADVDVLLLRSQATPRKPESTKPSSPLVLRRPVGPIADFTGPGAEGLGGWLLSAGNRPAPLAVLQPAAPLWKAGYRRPATAPIAWRIPRVDWRAALATAGRRLAAADAWLYRTPAGRQLAATLSPMTPAPALKTAEPRTAERKTAEPKTVAPKTVFSPPSLTGPVLYAPGDRLAMAPSRKRLATPPLQPRKREQPKPRRSRPQSVSVDKVKPIAMIKLIRALVDDDIKEFIDQQKVAAWAARAEAAVRAATDPNEPTGDAPPGDGSTLAPDPSIAPEAEELEEVSSDGMGVADELSDAGLATRLRRVCYAIDRRATAWRIAGELHGRESAALAIRGNGGWSRYVSTLEVGAGPVGAPGGELTALSGLPIDATRVVANLDAYESDRGPRLAQLIAYDARRLGDSSTALHRRLADEIEHKYRNANLRVAATSRLLERYLPPTPPTTQPVRDRIAGAVVQGRATTRTDLSLRLLPDPFGWRVGLEARGRVDTSTFANPGPVVLKSRSATEFHGRKLVAVDARGVSAAPAVCDASSQTRLTGLSSYYDNVPLLGGVIRSRARDEHAAKLGLARRQAEAKVAQRVRASLDQQVEPLIAKLRRRYSDSVVGRAAGLGLEITPVEMRTTESRLIARVRVANDRQLGSHTPRNRAPSDSLASVQMHESLLNNIIDGLALEGRRFKPAELRGYVRERLNLPPAAAETSGGAAGGPKPPAAELVFASREPVRVLFDGGRAELLLAIQRLTVGDAEFNRFKVHAFYEPIAEGIEARLVRVGGVQIEGRMRTAKRIRLHGVFGEVLRSDRPVPLLTLPPGGEPRLAGLIVSQLVLDGGWLGMAIGPEVVPQGRRVATIGSYVR